MDLDVSAKQRSAAHWAAVVITLCSLSSPVTAQEGEPSSAPEDRPSLPTVEEALRAKGRAGERTGDGGAEAKPAATARADTETAMLGASPVAPTESVLAGQREPVLKWNPKWHKFSLADALTIGASFAIAGGSLIFGPDQAGTKGGVWIDEDARDLVRLPSTGTRQTARDISDILLATVGSYGILVDAIAVAAWRLRSPDVASQLVFIQLETLGITTAIQSMWNVIASRERPYGRGCGRYLDEETHDCVGQNRFRSFFSGHTSQAFAAAGITCMNHAYIPLYTDGPANMLPCTAGFIMASAVGALRMAGDVHYFTDVAVGALVGTATGLGVPWLLYYRHGSPIERNEADPREGFTLRIVPSGLGARAIGTF